VSISVNGLTKQYGSQLAVSQISFDIKPGEIVGFLGPNGAGKTTTMKILTGYLKPTSGKVFVDGYSLETEAMKAKKSLGYLPEHNPLYLDMYVREFLSLIGKLYGMSGKSLKNRQDEIIELCGLELERFKKIGQLSKGYRQRVGLAQALIHDPSTLILDEPTTGLDPNQILEIRQLIKNIAGNKTILFSSHIMQEIEALCDRVIIIRKGQIVSDTSLGELRTHGSSLEEVFRKLTT
jgi:ABC-2 type transport system ATP-binding protein